jgi:hypothetical protein
MAAVAGVVGTWTVAAPSGFTSATYAGSTLVSELNRLANGGHAYPPRGQYLEEAGAADKWCGTTMGDVIGALNTKAGNTRMNFKELNGVCNQLAGTSDLDAVTALRTMAS